MEHPLPEPLLLVFPPAFCMGGTIPVMGQFMVRERKAFGGTAALMYGINTLGAAAGVFVAAYVLLPLLGERGALGAASAACGPAPNEDAVAVHPLTSLSNVPFVTSSLPVVRVVLYAGIVRPLVSAARISLLPLVGM